MSFHDTSAPSAKLRSTQQKQSRWTTRQLVSVALLCALSVLLSFIEFPIFAMASFLKLDVSLVPSVVAAFAYGTPSGLLCGIASAVVHGIITGNWVGALMNIIVVIVFIVPASLINSRLKGAKSAIIGMIIATICLIVGVSAANLVIDPLFYGIPLDLVVQLLVPVIVPFNLIKGVLVSALSFIVYRSIKGLIVKA